MWIGDGEFESYGYQKSAFIKGNMENLKPDQCYQILDKGHPNSADQYHFVPVDEEGHEVGNSALNTAGQVVYSIWEKGKTSSEYNISNHFIA